MKILLAIIALSVTLTGALAFNYGGDGTSYGHMGASVSAGTGGGGGCSNKLDFSQPCNSQYIVLGPMR